MPDDTKAPVLLPVLAIATSGEGCIIALRTDMQDHYLYWPERRGMDGYLVPMLQELLRTHGVEFAGLQRLGVVTGPGSFTGLRIGLAAAQGIGLALGVPPVGISAFNLWRHAAQYKGKLLVALDTLRDDVFCAVYDGDRPLQAPQVCTVPQWKAILADKTVAVCGDAPMVRDRIHIEIEPERLATALLDLTATLDPAAYPAQPLYLRAPEISSPRAA